MAYLFNCFWKAFSDRNYMICWHDFICMMTFIGHWIFPIIFCAGNDTSDYFFCSLWIKDIPFCLLLVEVLEDFNFALSSFHIFLQETNFVLLIFFLLVLKSSHFPLCLQFSLNVVFNPAGFFPAALCSTAAEESEIFVSCLLNIHIVKFTIFFSWIVLHSHFHCNLL